MQDWPFIETGITVVEWDASHSSQCKQKYGVAYADNKPTGLAYYAYPEDGEPVYRLTHVTSGTSILSEAYDIGNEEAMKRWIEFLLEFADWTQTPPKITSVRHALKYAAMGAFEQA